MADYCRQCTVYHLGLPPDHNTMSGISSSDDTDNDLFASVLCEGCGPTQVDHTGRCVSSDCLEKGHHMRMVDTAFKDGIPTSLTYNGIQYTVVPFLTSAADKVVHPTFDADGIPVTLKYGGFTYDISRPSSYVTEQDDPSQQLRLTKESDESP